MISAAGGRRAEGEDFFAQTPFRREISMTLVRPRNL
jgi:hypothetical protein